MLARIALTVRKRIAGDLLLPNQCQFQFIDLRHMRGGQVEL